MDSVIGVIVAIVLSALIGAGYYAYENSEVDDATQKVIAVREARSIVNFTNTFNAYVQANQAEISGENNNDTPEVVTATQMGLPASSGIDPLGQTLEGFVSTPYGSALSWIVAPVANGAVSYSDPNGGTETATTQEMMQKYGINTPVKAEEFWGQVAADIVKISSGKINGYVYNDVNGTFVPNLAGSLIQSDQASPVYKSSASHQSNSGTWDQLSNYFPGSNVGVPYPQTFPTINSPYQFSVIASSSLSKSPGYWVWALNLYNNWGSGTPYVSMNFYSIGYSPGCPAGSNGLKPQDYNGPDPSWPGNAQMYNAATDPSLAQNYLSSYICLPMSLTTYSEIAPNLDYQSACSTDGISCSAYDNASGTQIGYSASCSGKSCQVENLMDGEGYNPGNDGYQGEGPSESYWVNNANTFQNEADYLYGSYLITMPGGFQYSVLWSSGVNFDPGGDWAFFGNQTGLFYGNVVNNSVYTIPPEGGVSAYPWAFTKDGDINDVSSSNNQNFTILNLS